MKTVKINQEQVEADQAQLNKKNDEFIASLSLEDQNKFNAIGDAMKILTDAGVQCWLHPFLPTSRSTRDLMYQYNNFSEFAKFENGMGSEEDNMIFANANCYLAKNICSMIIQKLGGIGDPITAESISEMFLLWAREAEYDMMRHEKN